MIRPGFLSHAERDELRALARDGLSEGRIVRRANALVLLNDGWSCQEVAAALLIDDDSVRSWHKLYAERGLTGLVVFHHPGNQSRLASDQPILRHLPRIQGAAMTFLMPDVPKNWQALRDSVTYHF